MEDAQRVSTFMEPAEVGRWRIRPFSVNEQEFILMQAMAVQEGDSAEGIEMRVKRTVPPGDYICLHRLATPDERRDILEGKIVDAEISEADDRAMWVPIMSDTPSEISEQQHVFEHAHGRVLITGLGLGVVVSGLLANPEVEHITVVEIDRDVIALTGPYYNGNPRVDIVNNDALRYAAHLADLRENDGWTGQLDYAWHDIWSHIADRNLDDDEIAEHGISYATMFKAYEPFVTQQGAWGYEEALQMRAIKMREHHATITWARTILAADFETRVRMLAERIIHDRVMNLPLDEPIPPMIWDWFHSDDMRKQAGSTPTEYARRILERGGDDFDEKMRKILTIPHTDSDPMGRPNDVKEANVAR